VGNCLRETRMHSFYRNSILFLSFLIFFSSPLYAQERLTIQLKWFHQFQFAGYYAAIEKGFYAEEGLDVELRERDPASSHIDDVLEGRAQYGVADAGLILPRMQGQPVVLLTQIFQHSPLIFITLKESGLRTPYDLIAKRVTVDVKGHRYAALDAMLLGSLGGLDKLVSVEMSFRHQDLIANKIDAYAGYSTDQPFWFKQQNIAINIIDPRDFGIDFYGDNLFTTEQEIKDHPLRVEQIRMATLKGWNYALEHPDEIVSLILEKYNSQGFSRARLEFEARETAKMILPRFVDLGSYELSRYQKIAETYANMGWSETTSIDKQFYYSSYKKQLGLTDKEKAWLAAHPVIKVALDPDWAPIEYQDKQGNYQGISLDYLKRVQDLLGVRIEIKKGLSWKQAVEAVKTKSVDFFASVSVTPERKEYALFTKAYISMPIHIFARDDVSYIGNLDNLSGKRVAVVEGYAVHDWISKDYPDINLIPVKNLPDALDWVERGVVSAFVGNLVTTTYYSNKLQMSHIQLAGNTPYANKQAMAVRDDWPELRNIIEKALDAISTEERQTIFNRWMSIRFERAIDFTLLWQLLAVSILVVSVFLYWNRRLAKEVSQRKSAEEEVRNRELQLIMAADVAGMSNWEFDLRSRTFTFNNLFFSLLKTTVEREGGYQMSWDHYLQAFCHPEDMAMLEDKLQQALSATEEIQERIEYRVINREREVLDFLMDYRILLGKRGRSSKVYGSNIDVTQRKQEQQALYLAHAAIESANDSIFVIELESGCFLSVNQQACKLLGYTSAELTAGMHPYDLGLKLNAENWESFVRRVAENKFLRFETEIAHQNGEQLPVEISVNLLQYEGQSCVVGYMHDISERLAAERKLRESERYNRTLYENSPIGLALCRMNGELVDVNQAYADILGRSITETLALSYWDITPKQYEAQEERQQELLKKLRRYGPYEKEYLHKDGHLVQVQLSGLLIEQNSETYIWSSVEDITVQKQAAEALRQSEERFQQALNFAGIGAWDWDIVTGELHCSKQIAPLFGYPDGKLDTTYENFINAIHPDDRVKVQEAIKANIEQSVEYNIEHRVLWPDGSLRWLSERGSAVRDKEGKALNMLGVVQDITERKLAQDGVQYKTDELQAFNEAMVDREGRVIELKEEINQLCKDHGLELIYPAVWRKQ